MQSDDRTQSDGRSRIGLPACPQIGLSQSLPIEGRIGLYEIL